MSVHSLFLFICILCHVIVGIRATINPSNLVCVPTSSTSLNVTWTQASDASVDGYHLDIYRSDGLKVEYGLPSLDLNDKTYDKYVYSGLGKYATYTVTLHSYSGATNNTDLVINCTTDQDAPDGAPPNMRAEALSVSEIYVSWDTLQEVYWNGILVEIRLTYFGMKDFWPVTVNLSTSALNYTITGLTMDTKYVMTLKAVSGGGEGIQSAAVERTLGAPIPQNETKTRYYCYETVPGMLTISWESMPCTIYVGIIAFFMLMSLIFMILCCCACCCKGSKTNITNTEVNINNEFKDDDDYDDDYDPPPSYSEDEDEDDDVDVSDNECDDDEDDPADEDDGPDGIPAKRGRYSKKRKKRLKKDLEAGAVTARDIELEEGENNSNDNPDDDDDDDDDGGGDEDDDEDSDEGDNDGEDEGDEEVLDTDGKPIVGAGTVAGSKASKKKNKVKEKRGKKDKAKPYDNDKGTKNDNKGNKNDDKKNKNSKELKESKNSGNANSKLGRGALLKNGNNANSKLGRAALLKQANEKGKKRGTKSKESKNRGDDSDFHKQDSEEIDEEHDSDEEWNDEDSEEDVSAGNVEGSAAASGTAVVKTKNSKKQNNSKSGNVKGKGSDGDLEDSNDSNTKGKHEASSGGDTDDDGNRVRNEGGAEVGKEDDDNDSWGESKSKKNNTQTKVDDNADEDSDGWGGSNSKGKNVGGVSNTDEYDANEDDWGGPVRQDMNQNGNVGAKLGAILAGANNNGSSESSNQLASNQNHDVQSVNHDGATATGSSNQRDVNQSQGLPMANQNDSMLSRNPDQWNRNNTQGMQEISQYGVDNGVDVFSQNYASAAAVAGMSQTASQVPRKINSREKTVRFGGQSLNGPNGVHKSSVGTNNNRGHSQSGPENTSRHNNVNQPRFSKGKIVVVPAKAVGITSEGFPINPSTDGLGEKGKKNKTSRANRAKSSIPSLDSIGGLKEDLPKDGKTLDDAKDYGGEPFDPDSEVILLPDGNGGFTSHKRNGQPVDAQNQGRFGNKRAPGLAASAWTTETFSSPRDHKTSRTTPVKELHRNNNENKDSKGASGGKIGNLMGNINANIKPNGANAGMRQVKSDSDLASKDRMANADDQAKHKQIFYGFGMGRFRQAAAKWLFLLRKKNPPKTQTADWKTVP